MISVNGCGVGCGDPGIAGNPFRKLKKGLKRVGKAAKKAGADVVKGTRKSLPYLAVAANVVPGVGPALSVALGAAAGASEARKSKKRAAREAEAFAADANRIAIEEQQARDLAAAKLRPAIVGAGGSGGGGWKQVADVLRSPVVVPAVAAGLVLVLSLRR